jgi:2-isopropylmalate synthase
VDPDLYQHIDPQLVGNDMRMLVSEMAGRASIELKGRELGFDLSADPDTLSRVTNRVKELEACGYSFEAADASFELLLRGELSGAPVRFFEVLSWRAFADRLADGTVVNQATVKLLIKDEEVLAAGEGNGPVNALDNALRAALAAAYPALAGLELMDYKVRILTGDHGTASRTRVLITTSDGAVEWSTVGVDENVITASWQALVDAVTFGLLAKGETVL